MNYRELSGQAPFYKWAADIKAKIDVQNEQILVDRQKQRDTKTQICVGDVVLDGETVLRVAHVWDDSIQLTDGRFGASFYLMADGFCDYSGGLDSAIAIDRFQPTDEKKPGPVWFFSQNDVRAHNAYNTCATFRVWKLTD